MYKVHKHWSTQEAAEAGVTPARPVPGRVDVEHVLMVPPSGSPGPVGKETPDERHTHDCSGESCSKENPRKCCYKGPNLDRGI